MLNMGALLLGETVQGENLTDGLLDIIGFVMMGVGAVFAVWMFYLFFLMSTASDENKRRTAKARVFKTVSGLLIIIVLYSLLDIIQIQINEIAYDNSGGKVDIPDVPVNPEEEGSGKFPLDNYTMEVNRTTWVPIAGYTILAGELLVNLKEHSQSPKIVGGAVDRESLYGGENGGSHVTANYIKGSTQLAIGYSHGRPFVTWNDNNAALPDASIGFVLTLEVSNPVTGVRETIDDFYRINLVKGSSWEEEIEED